MHYHQDCSKLEPITVNKKKTFLQIDDISHGLLALEITSEN